MVLSIAVVVVVVIVVVVNVVGGGGGTNITDYCQLKGHVVGGVQVNLLTLRRIISTRTQDLCCCCCCCYCYCCFCCSFFGDV